MKIGVTGIFASGKGTVCAMFEELGAAVIDTDEIARQVQQPGSEGLNRIIREFGEGILNKDSSLNRRALAAIVFKDALKVERLNKIIHPLIFKKIESAVNENPDNIHFINTPLLFETEFHKFMDYNITVTADPDQVISRGIRRDGITENEIKERLNHQFSLNEKIKLADYVIDNSGSTENTKRQVLAIWKTLQQKKIKK
ncbi:MAG: dephospho-CoA kinase [Spirochaetes bacterium]|nr:dephospho-CoA kinase [Spirochaetota bacterium]